MTEFLWFAWSWAGLVIALSLSVIMFRTDILRSRSGSRFKDPAWYAWIPMLAYLIHQFEEYACNITNGQYDIVSGFYTGNLPFPTDGLPLLHFPLVNIALAWLGAPMAALLYRKNPAIGFSYFGFMLLNGLTHLASGLNPATNPGLITGALIFIPSAFWMIYLVVSQRIMSTGGLVVTVAAGILAHAFLFVVYLLPPLGAGVVFVGDVLCGFAPIIFAALGCRLFDIRYHN